MPRPTRAERQAQTRVELLQAAKTRFLAMGYAATTLEDIAEAAGYSKGAVYSNFPDKPTLCWEALDLIHREKTAEIESIIAQGASFAESCSAFLRWMDKTLGDEGWTMLEFEFVVLSRHDPRLRQMVAALREDWHQMAVAALREALAALGAPAQDPALGQALSDLANLLLCTGTGLSIQRAVAPSTDARTSSDVFRGLVDFVAAHVDIAGDEIRGLLSQGGQEGPVP